MTEEERELTRRWVQTWKGACEYLEAVRAQETAALTEAEAERWSDILLSVDCSDAPPRLSSGLVEQQAIFARWWKR